MPPKLSSFETYAPGSSSLPLLVRMPDGERRQVDVPPTTSVKDLKSTIAANMQTWGANAVGAENGAEWDLDFGGSVLNEESNLNDYHIPDAYDHASGLLRTISDSTHTDAGKKVEALDKACAVVQGISRGERDMERLISAVFDEENNNNNASAGAAAGGEDDTQPTLRAMKRRGRSKLPSLNFGSLHPHGSMGGGAPPTPSQLLRRLSTTRPDLYDPAAAARQEEGGVSNSGELKKNVSWFTGAPEGSGELKRGNTWFTDVISAIGNSVQGGGKEEMEEEDIANGEDVEGDSEGEAATSKRGPIQKGSADSGGLGGEKEGHRDTSTSGKDESEGKAEGKRGVDKGSSAESTGAGAGATAATRASDSTNVGGGSSGGGDGGSVGSGSRDESKGDVGAGTGSTRGEDEDKGESGSGSVSTGDKKEEENGTDVGREGSGMNTEKQMIGLQPEQTGEEGTKIPKKRGRKRKNPHLTEEERKAQRQAQNRESAKLSRIRRKNMTIEYEKRVTTLEGENENLRDTVAALTDRLEILQNLLTISVQKRPVPPQALQQALPQQMLSAVPPGASVAAAPNALGVLQPAPHQVPVNPHAIAHQQQHNPRLANMQYKNF